jgi:hypothetical protein
MGVFDGCRSIKKLKKPSIIKIQQPAKPSYENQEKPALNGVSFFVRGVFAVFGWFARWLIVAGFVLVRNDRVCTGCDVVGVWRGELGSSGTNRKERGKLSTVLTQRFCSFHAPKVLDVRLFYGSLKRLTENQSSLNMPRKKTAQPLPAESVDFGHVVVEVWDDGVYPIGRGLHKQAKFIELCSRIFEFVVPHYVTANEVLCDLDEGIMRSASSLDAALVRSGLFTEIRDLGSVRKRIYPKVKQDLKALINAKRDLLATTPSRPTPP